MTSGVRALALMALWGIVPLEAAVARAAGAGEDARAILIERDQHQRPKSEEYLGEIIVVSKDGKERRKVWRSYRSGPPGESDRLIRFLSPPDVRGVGYLAHLRRGKNPDEWLYLPSMKRERRIGVRDREGAFGNTSFSYEDLDLLEFDETRYDAISLSPQVVEGTPVHVIELRPRTASVYSRKVLTLRQDDLRLLMVEYFVARERGPVKRLTLANFTALGGYQIPTRMEMADLLKGGHTTVLLRDVLLDQPQPRDRYTIQNLLREDDGALPSGSGRPSASSQGPPGLVDPSNPIGPLRLPAGFSGYVDGRIFGFLADRAHRRSAVWGTIFLRQTALIGRARVTGAVRFENSSSHQVGPLVFDPADREPRRSPASIRELSLVVPLLPGFDVKVGRFEMAWGGTDGYSPADAFFPRDFADPLTQERLPVWGASLKGERGNVRFEVLATSTTTPWRLPVLGGAPSPSALVKVSFVENPWTVPTAGFQAARITGRVGSWDLGGWGRTGTRPSAVLDPHLEELEAALAEAGVKPPNLLGPAPAPPNLPDKTFVVPIDRHFTDEHAAGGSLSREYGGWILHGELGFFRSRDELLGNAAIWSIGGSRIVRNGTVTLTFAANAIEPPSEALLLFDRALLPCAIVATHENESWGSWGAVWLGTFETIGGVLAGELTKDLTDIVKVTVGADLPHGAPLSPANAFSGGQRVRAALRWSW